MTCTGWRWGAHTGGEVDVPSLQGHLIFMIYERQGHAISQNIHQMYIECIFGGARGRGEGGGVSDPLLMNHQSLKVVLWRISN